MKSVSKILSPAFTERVEMRHPGRWPGYQVYRVITAVWQLSALHQQLQAHREIFYETASVHRRFPGQWNIRQRERILSVFRL